MASLDTHELGRLAEEWLLALGLSGPALEAARVLPDVLTAAQSLGSWPAYEQLSKRHGEDTARMLQALGRLEPYTARPPVAEGQQEALRRMILALSDDLRVVMLSLALHQARQQLAVQARESGWEWLGTLTFRVQAPLAARLGVWQIKWALEDLAFRLTEPARYRQIAGWLDEKRAEREAFIDQMTERLQQLADGSGLTMRAVGRPKHIFSIYNKMRQKALEFDQLLDLRAFRLLTQTNDDCYAALALLQQHFESVEGEFDDYIARPKPNGYQSLHIILLDDEGRPFEVQIRTEDMHLQAEYGVAAHWKYKESGGSAARATGSDADQVRLIRGLIDWGLQAGHGPVRLSDETLYALTPQGRIVELPSGSTPLDFAYRLHTELGHRCRGALVDGQISPLTRPLKTGQTVEILAAKQGGPSRDWMLPELGYLASPRSRAKVRAWFHAQEQQRESDLVEADRGSAKALAELAAPPPPDGEQLMALALDRGTRQRDALSAPAFGKGRVLVVGVDRMLTSFARCCRPIPPDPILGYVTRGRGVSIHRQSCPDLLRLVDQHPERAIETSWGAGASLAAPGLSGYPVGLVLEIDTPSAPLKAIAEALAREKAPLTAYRTERLGPGVRLSLDTAVGDQQQLDRLVVLLSALPGVRSVKRA